ncbi:alpha/beta hydrolase [Paenalkalicoccus suaedae]|uniref:Alpha/beta hydrolase n=1 Tax=Paenalkalicoccus suaedae TaxID=2592382 RepID=A0A859FKH7_9BACI|nr:carboxylesterase [Paenalkalicoccus suaedae]QKS73305.1 alpha/beta hydrolase [Paenalkalicoccus suaedae]
MKIAQPKPFTIEAGKRAVLLLHGFTGNSADVRMMGRYLEKKGYSSHAPHMKGHGVPPEELVKTGPSDWWEDVQKGYQHLKDLGYEEIAVGGLSLGGVFSLKLGYTLPVKGIFTMCSPMYTNNEKKLYDGVLAYARQYKKYEGKDEEQIEKEMEAFEGTHMGTLKELRELVSDVRDHVDMIYTPTFVAQARNDEMIDPKSATFIHDAVEAENKTLKWYEESGHVITLDKERDQLHVDVHAFLESLDWSV